MNNYQEQYNKFFEMYKEIMGDYEELTSSPRYQEILETMPFEFLSAIQLCEKLSLFEKLNPKPRMHFQSLDEATVFYRNLINFNKKTDKLLEDASYIAEVQRTAEKLNALVTDSPYLGKRFCIEPNNEIIQLAGRCLTEIPQYPKKLTKAFRWNFIESAIYCLEKEDLAWLADSKVIKADDINHICLTESNPAYKEKVEFLCQKLGHPQPIIASYTLKLKGVTFPNEDGSSRQENLTALREYAESNSNKEIPLTASSYIYVPEIGTPEPAISVAWEGRVIGNIAKDAAAEITEMYTNPQFTASLSKVSGGNDGLNLGCVITLNVIAPEYAPKATEKAAEAQQER